MSKRYCAPLRISNVEIIVKEDEGAVRAFANVTFNGLLVVRGFRVVVNKDDCYYVAMPSIRKKQGGFASTVLTTQPWFKDLIEDVVMDAYMEKTGQEFDCINSEGDDDAHDADGVL